MESILDRHHVYPKRSMKKCEREAKLIACPRRDSDQSYSNYHHRWSTPQTFSLAHLQLLQAVSDGGILKSSPTQMPQQQSLEMIQVWCMVTVLNSFYLQSYSGFCVGDLNLHLTNHLHKEEVKPIYFLLKEVLENHTSNQLLILNNIQRWDEPSSPMYKDPTSTQSIGVCYNPFSIIWNKCGQERELIPCPGWYFGLLYVYSHHQPQMHQTRPQTLWQSLQVQNSVYNMITSLFQNSQKPTPKLFPRHALTITARIIASFQLT